MSIEIPLAGKRRKTHSKAAIKIIEVAEALIGREGIDRVSMRQIALCAGQSNPAAVQYHFGDREGLLDAIYKLRLDHLDRLRARLLAQCDPEKLSDLRTLLELIVLPIMSIESATGDYTYARFAVQMEHALGGPVSWSRVRKAPATVKIVRRLQQAVRASTPELADIKITLAVRLALTAILSVEDRRKQPWTSVHDDAAISTALDMAVAGLDCHASDPLDFRARLERARAI